MEYYNIRQILDAVHKGQIRIPAFQRGFVWEPEMVAFLMDSIYKNYPFGSLLFWRTKERLKSERKLGPFELPKAPEEYPVDYVLDGQQRVTSIFGVFQTEIARSAGDNWSDIYFDFTLSEDPQETHFFALKPGEVDASKHFPLKSIFDSAEYRRQTRSLDEAIAKRIDDMQSVFKEVNLPVQIIKTENKSTVAIIFERINRQGIALDTLQLLTAWTWSEEFQLQEQFEELSSELQAYGFTDINADVNLLLRCTAAALTKSASPDSLINLNGAEVRAKFSEVVNGIKGALDYLKADLKVESIENLPYQHLLIPLTTFFAVPENQSHKLKDNQRTAIRRWFWRSAFSKRYSSSVTKNLNTDIAEILKLKEDQQNDLGGFTSSIDASWFQQTNFNIGSVNTKTFILLLAQGSPRNFVSGTPINLAEKLKDYNRKEFHHLMPRSFLRKTKAQYKYDESCLANFTFISATDNKQIGGKAPSVYRQKMGAEADKIIETHLCPHSLFDDNYEAFVDTRSAILAKKAAELIK